MAEIFNSGAAGPGTHALVVGVSSYPFADGPKKTQEGSEFGIEHLSTAARSASEFAAWLIDEYHNPDVPLASVRVLLSPAEGEDLHPDVAGRIAGDVAATRPSFEAEFVAFRDAAGQSDQNVAIVYLAGHGVQLTKRGAILLLEDFGESGQPNLLYGSVDAAGCHEGMNTSGFPNQQFWFVDACRQETAVARKFAELTSGPYRPDVRRGDVVDSSPLFLAASPREAAFAEIGATSLFNQALLWALRGASATGPSPDCPHWHVRVSGLLDHLGPRVNELAAGYGEVQRVDLTGRVGQGIAQRFANPPEVPLVVDIEPDAAKPTAEAELLAGGEPPALAVPPGWPLETTVSVGLYSLRVVAQPPHGDRMLLVSVQPPDTHELVVLSS